MVQGAPTTYTSQPTLLFTNYETYNTKYNNLVLGNFRRLKTSLTRLSYPTNFLDLISFLLYNLSPFIPLLPSSFFHPRMVHETIRRYFIFNDLLLLDSQTRAPKSRLSCTLRTFFFFFFIHVFPHVILFAEAFL